MTERNKITVDWEFHPKQSHALDVLADPETQEVLFGGAKCGGKSVVGVRWLYMNGVDLINKFGLKPRKHPLPVAWFGRKLFSDFKKTTLATWKKEIPPEAYTINMHEKFIIIRNTIQIDFGGFDVRTDVSKFNSAEYAFVFIDQAEEISEEEMSGPRLTLRLKIKGQEPDYKLLLTANPKISWLKDEFITRKSKGKRFIQALPGDNPYAAKSYIDKMKDAFKHRPELLEAYLYGSWDILAGHDVVIKDYWIRDSHQRTIYWHKKRRVVVCDPARFGDCETVIYYMENSEIKDQNIYGKKDAVYTQNALHIMAEKHKIDGHKPLIILDADGLGGPIADNVREMGNDVYEIHSAAKALESDRYVNVRAEMWDTAARKFESGEIMNEYIDEELDRQLSLLTYDFKNGKITVGDKIAIESKMNRRMDRADTFIMGLYGLQFATADEDITPQIDRYLKARKRKKLEGQTALSA